MAEDFNNDLSSSVNDENESENLRNSNKMGGKLHHQSKQSTRKNFMAPTISASSKLNSFSPKKKILVELREDSSHTHHQKSPNLGLNSNSRKVAISNSGSRKSLPKISQTSSNIVVDSFHNGDKDDTFIPDSSSSSSDKPYDPLTNYLSPRPKFLRYNPNRHRGKDVRIIESLICLDSQGFNALSTEESSLVLEDGGNGQCEDDHGVSEEDESETEEEMVEENMDGISEEQELVKEEEEDEEEELDQRKSGFKWVIFKSLGVFVVLVFSTMCISCMNSQLSFYPLVRRGFLFEDYKLGNMSFGVESLKGSEVGNLVFDGMEQSEMGIVEIDQGCVEIEGDLKDFDLKCYEVGGKVDFSEVSEPILESIIKEIEEEYVESEAPMVAADFNQMIHGENSVDFVDELAESEPKSEDIVKENVYDHVEELADSEPTTKDIQLGNEVDIVAEVLYEGNEEENEYSNSKLKDGKLEHEPEVVAEELDDKIELESDSQVMEEWLENEEQQFWQISKTVGGTLISVMMALMTSLITRFYFSCKKASSKSNSSNVKLCSTPQKAENNSLNLPTIFEERIEPIKKAETGLNASPVIPSREERLEKTPPRVIPKVKVLSEFAIEGNFKSSLNGCSMISKMQEKEEFHPPEKKAMKVKESRTTNEVDSRSNGSCIPMENATNEKGTPTPTPLRRSSRLRSRGVTSP